MSTVLTAPLLTGRTTWSRVEDGFHVASRAGEYVGFVERTADGHFVGFDGRSTPVGRYESLTAARRAVAAAARSDESGEMSPRMQVTLQAAASVAGVVAVGTFAAAVLNSPLL